MHLSSLLFGASLYLAVAFAGCSRHHAEAPAAQATGPVIHFERTPCMGRCPSFAADITADGKGHYKGGAFAWKEGEADFQLKADVVGTVRAEAKEMSFAQMPEDEYGRGMMDAPSAILTIDGHTVKCTGGECPEALKNLHRYLDAEIQRALGVGPEH